VVVNRVVWWSASIAALACLGAVAADAATENGAPNWPWIVSRATGFVAYALLWLTTVTGTAMSLQRERPRSRAALQDWHRTLNLATWLFVGAHVAVLLVETHVGYSVAELVVPFASSTGGVGLAAGIVAAELALVVAVTFSLRGFLGPRLWRILHLAAYPAWALAWTHLLLSGTSLEHVWVRLAVLASGLAIAVLACLRAAVALRLLPRPTADGAFTPRERRAMAAVSAGGALLGLVTAILLGRTQAGTGSSTPPTSSPAPAATESTPGPAGVSELPEPVTRSRGS
jgi:sulfoxide reductase heme-binding subunit YedZ